MTVELTCFPYLSAILFSCIAGLLVILFIPRERESLVKWISLVFSGIALAFSIYVYCAYDRETGGLQFVEKVLWVESLGIHYFNGADGFNLPLILLTGIVHFTGVLTMWELRGRVKEFFAFVFVLVLGVFGFFMSMDLFFLFVWYDVSLFPMYPLIAIWGTTRKEYGPQALPLSPGGKRPGPSRHRLSCSRLGTPDLRHPGAHATRGPGAGTAGICLCPLLSRFRDPRGRLALS
jgi:NADH-quinone oxidoreductase subunit M